MDIKNSKPMQRSFTTLSTTLFTTLLLLITYSVYAQDTIVIQEEVNEIINSPFKVHEGIAEQPDTTYYNAQPFTGTYIIKDAQDSLRRLLRNYKNGLKHGLQYRFKTQTDTTICTRKYGYKKGIKHGPHEKYTPSGYPELIGQWHQGEEVGVWKRFTIALDSAGNRDDNISWQKDYGAVDSSAD